MHKLSASALSAFLRSPKLYYWQYIAKIEPIQQQVATFDHDKLFGILWAQFTDRFYKSESEEVNTKKTLNNWLEQTEGWVPEKARDRLTKALETLMPQYYQMFSPSDGCRLPVTSELHLENERFHGYLDGLSADNVVHEVKTTSRSPQLSEQLWKVQNSIQVKLYCVLANANGVVIEFGFKDPPNQLFRAPVMQVSEQQRKQWEQELNALADKIQALGTDPNNYACHPDNCCITTKNFVSMCAFQCLCDQGLNSVTEIAYKAKQKRQ